MISPSGASIRRQQQLVWRNRRLLPDPALLTSTVAREGELSATHCSYDALLLNTMLSFLSQLCAVCIRIETLFLGVKEQSLQRQIFLCCFSEFAL